MATETKKKYEVLVSPRGTAVWPQLTTPDTKFNAQGLYHVKLALDPEDPKAKEFLRLLDARNEAHCDECKEAMTPKARKTAVFNTPYSDELDEDGNETGKVLVNFKMFATRTDKKDSSKTYENKPKFFDSRGTPIVVAPRIGSGSELKISYSISGYNTPKGTGITLYLNAVQVLKLVEWNGTQNAASLGFEEEEDGFTTGGSAEGFSDEGSDDEF